MNDIFNNKIQARHLFVPAYSNMMAFIEHSSAPYYYYWRTRKLNTVK